MANNLSNRLKKLESDTMTGDEVQPIFRRIVQPGSIDTIVNGWYFGDGDSWVNVWRNNGETDDDLRERAEGLCRVQTCAIVSRLISM